MIAQDRDRDATPSLVLLPGLDGTGRLFGPLLATLPPSLPTQVVSYPRDQAIAYRGLVGQVSSVLPKTPFVLVAESFSGPIALLLAIESPPALAGIVLVASFTRSPVPRFPGLRAATRLAVRLRPPGALIRALLVGPDAKRSLVAQVQEAIASVDGPVLASRALEILDLNVDDAFVACQVPVLYLAGKSDRLVSTAACSRLKRLKPGMEVVVLKGPHLVLQREPHRAAEEITAFVRRVTGGGGAQPPGSNES